MALLSLPVATVLAKRYKDKKDRETNHTPFVVNPRVGLFDCKDNGGENNNKSINDKCNDNKESNRTGINGGALQGTDKGTEAQLSPLWGTPLKCTQVEVKNIVHHKIHKCRITMLFTATSSHFDFYFPVSEVGEVTNISCSINGRVFQGEVVRRGPLFPPQSFKNEDYYPKDKGDATASLSLPLGSIREVRGLHSKTRKPLYNRDTNGLIPFTDEKRFMSGDDNDDIIDVLDKANGGELRKKTGQPFVDTTGTRQAIEKDRAAYAEALGLTAADMKKLANEPQVFYILGRRISEELYGPAGYPSIGGTVKVVVDFTTKIVEKTVNKCYRIVFPMTCVAAPPSHFSLRINMPDTIQRIAPLSRTNEVLPLIDGTTADVMVECDVSSPMHVKDYIFALIVELGPPIEPRLIDPMSLFIFVTSMALMVLGVMTKDLIDII